MEACNNCRFFLADSAAPNEYRAEHRCQRYAPKSYDGIRYYELELLRDIARSLRTSASIGLPTDSDHDLNTEASEAVNFARWPTVDLDDWCGEWEAKS